MVPSRTIHLFKPSSWAFTHYHNLRRDRDLLNTSTYQVIGPGEISEEDLLRITELYRALYLGKYTPFNPQYNERFFSLVVRGDFFVFRALKDEQVDAFVAYYLDDHGVTASLIGYDTTLPIGRGLYRQAFALFFREVGQRGEVLNLSAGAASFKEMRGSIPCVEYYAVFDSHLPFYRRIAWHLAWAGGLFQHATVWRWNRNKSRQARTASLRNLPG